MDSELIKKIKQLNEQADIKKWTKDILSSSSTAELEFPLNNLSIALGDLLDANIYIVTTEGDLQGFYERHRVNPGRIRNMVEKKSLPFNYMKRLKSIDQTTINVDIHDELTIFPVEKRSLYPDALTSVIPVDMSSERLGYLIIGRMDQEIYEEERYFLEHAAAMVGAQLSFDRGMKEVEVEQKKHNAELALSALAKSEVNALKGIFEEMGEETEMRITASDIADKLDITRSIVVNSLRKLVSASIIDQRSMGMKGTYIKILNPYFVELLYEQR